MLTFNEADHLYCWDGEPVPNVTRVLAILTDWSRVQPGVLQRAINEGTDMHRMVELHAKDDLDEASLPEWLRPRLAAWKLFLSETGFEILASEQRVFHPGFRYAGTADLFGIFQRVRIGRSNVRRSACVDLKRSFYGGRSIGLQTAAYSEAWAAMGNPCPSMRCALQLREDGTYRLQHYTDRTDFSYFAACLQVHRLKEEMAA